MNDPKTILRMIIRNNSTSSKSEILNGLRIACGLRRIEMGEYGKMIEPIKTDIRIGRLEDSLEPVNEDHFRMFVFREEDVPNDGREYKIISKRTGGDYLWMCMP